MTQNSKKTDPGFSISIEVSREFANDLVREIKPWLVHIGIGATLLTVLGSQVPRYLTGPEPPLPLPTEVQREDVDRHTN